MLCWACVQSEADAGSEATPAAPARQEPPCRCPEGRNERPPDTELARLGVRPTLGSRCTAGFGWKRPSRDPRKTQAPLAAATPMPCECQRDWTPGPHPSGSASLPSSM